MISNIVSELVDQYFHHLEDNNKSKLLFLLAENFVFQINKSHEYNKSSYKTMIGWDFSTNMQVEFEILEKIEPIDNDMDKIITVETIEKNDFLQFIGIEKVNNQLQFQISNNKIEKLHLKEIDAVLNSISERVEPKLDWVEENYPDLFQEIYDEHLIYNEQTGEIWQEIMDKWNSKQEETLSTEKVVELTKSKFHEVQRYTVKTPLYSSPIGKNSNKDNNKDYSNNLFIKAENVQYTGSFKIRGAASKLTNLKAQGKNELITSSTGNHGLAVATLADKLGMDLTIFVPKSITQDKENKLLKYPVKLEKIQGDPRQAEEAARLRSEKGNIPFVSPYNDPHIIAGQGSIAMELENQCDLSAVQNIYITVGGGGLISGIGCYLKEYYPNVEIIGAQPENSPVMYESIREGEIIKYESKSTLSDGSAGGIEKDAITFELVKSVVDRFILVSEDEIKSAILDSFLHHNAIIEGSAGVALGAFKKDQSESDTIDKSIVIWCGGNISPNQWKSIINNHE